MIVSIEELEPNLLYSPLAKEGDTRPADIYTFEPKKFPHLAFQLNRYSQNLRNRDNHRLSENYFDINFFDYPIVTMYKRGNIITGFATGWNRDFYPDKTIRLLNRFYHDKENSRVRFTRELLRPSSFHCVQQQLLLAERLGYDYAFISREPRTNKFFRSFIDALSQRGTHKWEYKDGPYLVAPNPPDPTCWQSIGLVKLRKTNIDFWSHWNEQTN